VIDLFAVPSQDAKAGPGGLVKECEAFLARGKVTLSAVKDSAELFRRINLLDGERGGRNPFVRNWRQKEDSAADACAENTPNRNIRYTGYMESGGNHFVVINGNEYSPNQVIKGTDLAIKEASKSCVVLVPTNPDGPDAEAITILKEVEDDVYNP
jgi:hypothetical protein